MARLIINENKKIGHINPEIYGHFAEHLGRCIYGGVYVGENLDIPNTNGMRNDVVAALKEIQIPVLRWPGGCFADEYHWKDGIGPKEKRKKMINTHWGGVVEDNSFGTHEYMELCKQLGCKTYVNGNLGSGTVKEMSEWVEYMTFDGVSPMADLRKANGQEKSWKIDYFGVGNENWGCGGNMRPSYYADLYRRYQTYVRDYKSDEKIHKVCCGANIDDYAWTETVLKVTHESAPTDLHGFMDGLSLHYYVVPDAWDSKGSATDFDKNMWYQTLKKALYMDTIISRHESIMDQYDPLKQIGMMVDEWGCWFDVEPGTNPGFLYQQNTMRDALVAGITLNIFNKHCSRVKMANIAQMVNVLQAVILTEGEKMLLTPTYHIFNMYKCHQNAELLDSYLEPIQIGEEEENKVPNLQESVSLDAQGNINITINNLSIKEAYDVQTILAQKKINSVYAEILTQDMAAYNTFSNTNKVHIQQYEDVKVKDKEISFQIPPCSVMKIKIQ